MGSQMIFGTSVLSNKIPEIKSPFITFPGQDLRGNSSFSIDDDLMSKHILLLGGSGCGKTNAFFFVLEQLRASMTEEDVAIIFDTKGEFYDAFFQPGDYVIGNSAKFRPISHTWNIFDEVLADGWDDSSISMNAREIAASLFHDRGSDSQPFFCNAARDIFRGVILDLIRQYRKEALNGYPGIALNNSFLIEVFRSFTIKHYQAAFSRYSDLRPMLQYLGDGRSNQALGVFAELNSMLADFFEGIFVEHSPEKSLSMRNAIKKRGGKALFIEYDLSVGETLTPVYRLLVDQALKEALSRTESKGKVFLVADEFKLLPKLQHIDDALNFGRGLGVKVIAGIQSIDQIYDIYGEDKGSVIASGFGSIFAFHTNDMSSRKYITERFGSNISLLEYEDRLRNTTVVKEREGSTVEEWDQIELGLGQAAIGLGYNPPFVFQFDEYRK